MLEKCIEQMHKHMESLSQILKQSVTIFVERTDPAKNESQTEKKKINLQLLN